MLSSGHYGKLALVGALAAGLAASGTAAAEQTYQWRMATAWGSGPLMDIGAKAFAERLEFLSDGRIKIEVFPGGAIGEPLRVTDSVRRGIADLGHTWGGYDWGRDTTTVVFGGFAGSMDDERMLHWLYQGGGVDLWKEFRLDQFGVVAMPLYMRTAETFLHSRVPVRTLEDLRGVKIRTAGAWIAMLEELGAAPVTSPGAEVYPMLERGVIDATEWGSPWEDTFPKFYEVTDYVILPGVHQPVAPFELQINQQVWDGLSARDQGLIELAAKLVTLESWMRIGHEDASAIKYYEEVGQTLIDLDVEVQIAGRTLGISWAEEQSKENAWFKRVWESQRDFERLWSQAERYRRLAPEVRLIGLD
jgi:TRAP-type mannitol/chloroaromatic compound transport system substrate-binding protein